MTVRLVILSLFASLAVAIALVVPALLAQEVNDLGFPALNQQRPSKSSSLMPAVQSATTDEISTRRTRYRDLERSAAELANSYRQRTKAGADTDELRDLETKISKIVDQAFAARQALQDAEIEEYRSRLSGIEKRVERRAALRKQIVRRRVHELTAGDELVWDPYGTAPRPNSHNRDPISLNGASKQATGGVNRLFAGDAPNQLEQSQQPQVFSQVGGSPSNTPAYSGPQTKVQLLFKVPTGLTARIQPATGGGKTQSLICPARYETVSGQSTRFLLTTIPGYEGVELTGSVTLAPAQQATNAYLSHSSIPISFTEEDFDQVISGNLVTKVLFLPNKENAERAIAGLETILSTRLDPGIDPLKEANGRGYAIATVRVGNRSPANAPSTKGSQTNPHEDSGLPGGQTDPTGNGSLPTPEVQSVVWVNQQKHLCWISCGSTDGLAVGTRFEVQRKVTGKRPKQKIGEIEITRILKEHLSEARIISADITKAISVGDHLREKTATAP